MLRKPNASNITNDQSTVYERSKPNGISHKPKTSWCDARYGNPEICQQKDPWPTRPETSGEDQISLTHFYQSQIIPTISHASPALYPFITDNQKGEQEKEQQHVLRII
jgi:hypothetical protein